MREIVHIQAGQCGNQIGAKVSLIILHFSGIKLFIFSWKYRRFDAPPFLDIAPAGFCCCHTCFFLVLINVNLYCNVELSKRSWDSKPEPKICENVSIYRIPCMTHSCIPFHLKLFMRVGLIIPRLNLTIVFSLLFYVYFKMLCLF